MFPDGSLQIDSFRGRAPAPDDFIELEWMHQNGRLKTQPGWKIEIVNDSGLTLRVI